MICASRRNRARASAHVAASADAFDAGLLVLDYIQRIAPPGEHGDRRGSVDAKGPCGDFRVVRMLLIGVLTDEHGFVFTVPTPVFSMQPAGTANSRLPGGFNANLGSSVVKCTLGQ